MLSLNGSQKEAESRNTASDDVEVATNTKSKREANDVPVGGVGGFQGKSHEKAGARRTNMAVAHLKATTLK
jgi:hypothetical protein